MKLFIIGKYNAFVYEIINKFTKEGHKVYVLTDEKNSVSKPPKVFEQYCFSYVTDSITEILDSVQPDAVLFTGAYDQNFTWSNPKNETMHYMSSLINLLMSSQYIHVKQFIYLSSHEVFGEDTELSLKEETPTAASSFKGLAIAQGEALCKHFQEKEGLDVSILRIDHLYKTPQSLKDADDICSKMCLEAIHTGGVSVNAKHNFALTYVSDAVEGIYQLAVSYEHKQLIYHLTSGEIINQREIARCICLKNPDIKLRDKTTGTSQSIVLDGSAFCREFSFQILHSYSDTIPLVYRRMKRHKKRYPADSQNRQNNSLFARFYSVLTAVLPYLENLLLFIPAFMLNNRAVGNVYFGKLDFYVLYVLLFAGVYGTKQAVFSAVLSVAGFCFRQMYGRTGMDLLIDYSTYLWVAQLFIIAMSVGHLRDSAKLIAEEKEEEIRFLNTQLSEVTNINESNNRIKNIYQNQIINYDDSLVKIYEITSELDSREAGAVLFYAANVISRIMETKDVAIYQVANSDYCRLFSSTSPKSRSLGKSLEYSKMTEMTQVFENHQVYINKTMNENYPLMASAIYQNGKPMEFIMLWGLPFEKMTLHHANLLTVLGYMIYHSVERANRYLEALSNTRFIDATKILTEEAFDELYLLYDNAMKEGFIEYCILEIPSTSERTLSEWSSLLSSHLRLTDYLGINQKGNLCILLTNSTLSDASFIIDRLAKTDILCTPYP